MKKKKSCTTNELWLQRDSNTNKWQRINIDMQKIKELMRKIDIERNTIKRLSLLEELDALVTKIRREEEIKYKKERKL